MCTLTYLRQGDSLIITSSRDENPKRLQPTGISQARVKGGYGLTDWYFPQDPVAGGTWLITNGKGVHVCLLNGGLENHIPKDNYPYSRGLVPLHIMEAGLPSFVQQFNGDHYQPFTLIYIEHSLNSSLIQLVWDGSTLHEMALDPYGSYIWSSSTLYTPAQKTTRASWFFHKSLEASTPQQIFDFHNTFNRFQPETSILMKRQGIETVSISQIISSETHFSLNHLDLLSNKKYGILLNKHE